MSPARLVRALFVLFLAVLFTSTSRAQVTTISDTTSTPVEGAGHDYIHLLSETVNPANGSINLHIQLPMPKGRGITVPFAFAYNSNGLRHVIPGGPSNPGLAQWFSNEDSFAVGGWSYEYPSLRLDNWTSHNYVLSGENNNQPIFTDYPCNETSNYLFSDGTGGIHSLGLGTQNFITPPPGGCPDTPGSSGASGDAQVYGTLLPNGAGDFRLFPITVYDKAGTVYYFPALPGGGFSNSVTMSGLPAYIEDRNGNKITTTQNGNIAFTFTDTLGRTAVSVNGFGPSGATNTVFAGGLSYQVTWKTVSGNYTVPATNIQNLGGLCTWPSHLSFTTVVISQITLQNGQSFHFYYGSDNPDPSFQNPYGMLSEIDYPSGGSVKYTWKLSDNMNELAVYTGGEFDGQAFDSVSPVTDGCIYQYQTPVVASRQVFYGASPNPARTQTFLYTTNWNSNNTSWSTKNTKVTTTDNVHSQSALVSYIYSSYLQPIQPFQNTNYPAQIPQEQTISYYNWGNTSTPLRTVTKGWTNPFDLASQQTTLQDVTPNLTSQTFYSYVTTGGIPSTMTQLHETDEYDFGASSPTRSTVTTYQTLQVRLA